MGFACGIVGLPNVGKSTLFNALTRTAQAQAANYPFCTIEPNVGEVAVPDDRLQQLAVLAQSQNILPARMNFVDIAGLVRGAASGEGLGNKFLANIREADAIVHVLRCFDDGDITHVDGRIDPCSDAATVNTELMLSDLESLEKRVQTLGKRAKADKDAARTLSLCEQAIAVLQEGIPARTVAITDPEDIKIWHGMALLTAKPVLYVCNVAEADAATGNAYTAQVAAMAATENASHVVISAAAEADMAVLSDAERAEFLAMMGLSEPALNKLIRAGYGLLGLMTYFTIGPKEARAWTIKANTRAPQAAGVIHSDFERGFIRAEVIAFDDFIACGSETACRDTGKMRLQGKEYVVCDGDVLHFRFNA